MHINILTANTAKEITSKARWLIICLLIPITTSALAEDIDDARNVATNILERLEQKKFSDVWDSYVSDWFKEKTTKPAFLGNLTMIHNQLGGKSKNRVLIQQNEADGDIATGYKGKVFSFMYETKFPAANAYETMVLISESGDFKLAGFNYMPNPN